MSGESVPPRAPLLFPRRWIRRLAAPRPACGAQAPLRSNRLRRFELPAMFGAVRRETRLARVNASHCSRTAAAVPRLVIVWIL